MSCEWFALCTNEAAGLAEHSVLGDVPICWSCADKMGFEEDKDSTWERIWDNGPE